MTAINGSLLSRLLVRLQTQDYEAFDELVALISPRLYREANKYFKDPDDVQSTVNWVLTKFWTNASKYKPHRPAMPYIISVLRNYCRDCWRRESRLPTFIGGLWPQDVSLPTEDEANYKETLKEAISPDLLTIVYSHIFDQEPLERVALARGISVIKAKKCLAEARSQLTEFLKR